ncbi:MAG: thiamine diphosphokinase [Ignavibacteria bacterium RIFOXYB2_FULL_35_12]|nr:MAG: thiamine diphosphokinase [Ignavibacteria bacterium GWA2_36_19]OGU55305.1 MAG: thiamine diphosphokinase [Ignavibacteria bacterium GWC2_35_8]OGU59291.1 MAG: thiamine diphosphokinase [Ignavibacteria bacterium GWF2_35_20]OGU78366.1 MAG: thiamine diphosphokinase [Ignavibacteria bacterium RIFOXYA2_FULL_35_9]OGU86516.1 MAG: thiamine diphosphokinase [Ignavibacteria bacterium RIFOXYA12_FULL_35_25]OGU86876.1 MAG: thiamine diphosphokinase [Ignavibacteria bacterium RIFOXYC12_FULL_35_11]OGU97765.1
MKKCLILANGKPPAKNIITFLMRNSYSTLFCADGGANSAMKMGLIPDYIIGDLDSIHEETLKYFKDKARIIKISRQNDTDVEKCLKHAIKHKFEEAVLTGVTGDRLDHTFCNLGIVLKFFNEIGIKIIAENSLLTALTGNHIIPTFRGETISIYGIDNRTKISSKGLKYPLNKIALPFGHRESTSNVSLHNKIELKIKGGIIFLIRDFQKLREHGIL